MYCLGNIKKYTGGGTVLGYMLLCFSNRMKITSQVTEIKSTLTFNITKSTHNRSLNCNQRME